MPHLPGVRHRWVDAGGLRVHLAEAGPEDAEPVLMLHGWPQHWYEWRGLVPRMSHRYRLLMPDLRGLGWTEAPRHGYEKENLARDQIALLDALGIERVKLMGHDWGGYAGFLMCLLAPERVERYVATNIVHPWPKPSPRAVLNFWRMAYQLPMLLPFIAPRITRKRGFIKLMLNGAKKGVFTGDELEAFEAPYRDRDRSFATAKYYRSFQTHDLPLLLRRRWTAYRLSVPTLMLYGAGDVVITPSSLEGSEPFADDMRIETVPDAGHFIVDAQPELVAERALEFFEAV
ncbi:MAG TPA: alpha/beta hydrolase [Thermoleophilaceae bacterium]|nr:alpha/beta hydrolase [Thermoleophilaceae bacterium]